MQRQSVGKSRDERHIGSCAWLLHGRRLTSIVGAFLVVVVVNADQLIFITVPATVGDNHCPAPRCSYIPTKQAPSVLILISFSRIYAMDVCA